MPLSLSSCSTRIAPWQGCARAWSRIAVSILAATRFGCGTFAPGRRSASPRPHRSGSCAGCRRIAAGNSRSACRRGSHWTVRWRVRATTACVVLPCLSWSSSWSSSWSFVFEGCVATPSNPLPRGPATANRARRLLRSAPGSVGGLCQVITVGGQAGVVSCLLCPQEKDLRGLTCPVIPASQGGPSVIPARIDRTT